MRSQETPTCVSDTENISSWSLLPLKSHANKYIRIPEAMTTHAASLNRSVRKRLLRAYYRIEQRTLINKIVDLKEIHLHISAFVSNRLGDYAQDVYMKKLSMRAKMCACAFKNHFTAFASQSTGCV